MLGRIAPLVQLMEVETLKEEVQNSLWQERLLALFCAFFAGVALLLTATGLYALLAYSVARRQRELGIRIALGAQLSHVLQAVGGRVTVSVGIGLAAGLLVAALLVRLTRSFLFGVQPLDPLSFALAALGILLCGAAASLLPSLRAARTDAAIALREE
jgi:ABC-type antimicrobial peptide transport system permease subunit